MELLRECLLNKMPVNQGDAAGEFEASSELEADEVQKWKKKWLNQYKRSGNTALHWAARAGHMDIISALLAVPQVNYTSIHLQKLVQC